MRNRGKLPGIIVTAAGIMVILSMLLPSTFWWFLFGVALITVGICIIKR